MLKTWLIDGDKGGVGKSLATRALVHHLLTKPDGQRPLVAVFDADMSNPDVCGTGGLSTANSDLERADIIDLSVEYGWIQLADALADLRRDAGDDEVRVIVNMPAQIGPRAFRGDIPLVSEVLREAGAVPVWMLSRTDESIRTLDERVKAMPERFATGLALRNLFFGAAGKFTRWEQSPLRTNLLEQGWTESGFPEINDEVISRIGRMPFHVALESGLEGHPLSHGYRLVLDSWLRGTRAVFTQLEQIQPPSGE
jgi:hypothetical protein